ncbi:MAG: ABC transporter permease, partial [Coprobacillus sp.]
MHTFIHQFKVLTRDRITLFWTIIFPLILATFFNMAFSKLNSSEGFDPAKVAVIIEKENKELKSLLDELSKEGDDQLLDITYTSSSNAQKLLENEEVSAYLTINDELKLTIQENGISQTIIQSVVDTYQQLTHSLNSIAKLDPSSFMKMVQEKIDTNQNYFESENVSSLDATVVYFYTLIGMTCMYAGFGGLTVSTNIEANLSKKGARVNVAPVSKIKMILTGNLAAFIMQYLSLVILLIYLTFGLGIDFGHQTGYILLLMAIGCYVGVTLGNLIGTLLNCKENTKVSILSSTSLFLSFLSGMMVVDMKYWVQEYIPILAKINPVSLITDALYALYYYPTYERFFSNLAILGGMGVILTIVSIMVSRRKKYASI